MYYSYVFIIIMESKGKGTNKRLYRIILKLKQRSSREPKGGPTKEDERVVMCV
jgi:hypothetical protein